MNLHENIAAFKMMYGKGPKPKSGALSLKGEVDSVGALPMEGNQDGDVYIVGQPSSSDKAEYYWFKGTWNYLGETPIDLSTYATVEYVDDVADDLMPKSSIVKLNSMDEFNALAEKTADWYFIKEG